jgi:hypothetical protein
MHPKFSQHAFTPEIYIQGMASKANMSLMAWYSSDKEPNTLVPILIPRASEQIRVGPRTSQSTSIIRDNGEF